MQETDGFLFSGGEIINQWGILLPYRLLIPITWTGWVHFYSGNQLNRTIQLHEGFCWAFPDKVFPFAWPAEKRCVTSSVIVFAYNFHSPSENSLHGYYKITIKKTQ